VLKLFELEIVRATYGYQDCTIDVTCTLNTFVAKNRGKRLSEFGYVFSRNGCMNKAFGDPCPGKEKFLTVEYRWRTPQLSLSVAEDKKVEINFNAVKQFL